jgi:hypothetical protein
MYTKKLEAKLRQIIMDNEGDRDDIYQEVFAFVKPLIDGLEDIAEPSGPFSVDRLKHAENVIENVKAIAAVLLDF